jgi:hypothetical protein
MVDLPTAVALRPKHVLPVGWDDGTDVPFVTVLAFWLVPAFCSACGRR